MPNFLPFSWETTLRVFSAPVFLKPNWRTYFPKSNRTHIKAKGIEPIIYETMAIKM